jgi:hypothetical protein
MGQDGRWLGHIKLEFEVKENNRDKQCTNFSGGDQ